MDHSHSDKAAIVQFPNRVNMSIPTRPDQTRPAIVEPRVAFQAARRIYMDDLSSASSRKKYSQIKKKKKKYQNHLATTWSMSLCKYCNGGARM